MSCKLNSGEEIYRIISIIDDDIIISDMVENNNKDWDIFFNFAPQVEIKEEDDKFYGKSEELSFTYMTVDSCCTTIISEGSYSDIYNKKIKIKKLITSTGNNYVHHIFSLGKQSVESISLHSNEITYFCSNGNIYKVLF